MDKSRESLNFYEKVFKLALPIAGQSLITIGVNMLDTIMVGKLGDEPLSATSLANSFISVYQIFCMGLGMGASVLVSRYWGMKQYEQDEILLICDGAAWHKSISLNVPANIHLFYIPPYTPEMNPIEQIWTKIRKRGFKNVIFKSLDAVIDKICDVVNSLEHSTVSKITSRNWMFSALKKLRC